MGSHPAPSADELADRGCLTQRLRVSKRSPLQGCGEDLKRSRVKLPAQGRH